MTRKLLVVLAILVALAAVGYGAYAWHYSISYVWTDDAYVEGTISPVAAKVAGHVVELLVEDNQTVEKDQVLLTIDPRDYEARWDQARAAVAVAEAGFLAARSEIPLARETTKAQADEARALLESAVVGEQSAIQGVTEAQARVEAKDAAVAALRAELVGARSMARKAALELERIRRLKDGGYVAERDFDQAEGASDAAHATAEATERRLAQAEKELEQVQAELVSKRLAVSQARQRVVEARAVLARADSQRHQVAVKEAEVGRAEARLQEAKADLATAELQLEHTRVLAPVDGVISKRTVERGQVVQMGQPLLAIVPLHAVWVVANFKETQLGRVRPGMEALVRVDTFPDKDLRGRVESISAGTGARFSLLPPENATGNWVKVVQRVPVKIVLDERAVGNPHTLRAGMSALVTIRVR